MKTKLLLLGLLVTSICLSQQGINYKAQIKDSNGDLVSNQNITIQFTILQGVAETNVYQETHTPTTDVNGIAIVNIGEGYVDSGVFADIDWGIDDHYLNVQIDTGTGLTDMGTTQFMAVPYAYYAKTIGNPASGLEAINEGNGIGWRVIGRDALNYGNIGDEAFDFSMSENNSEIYGSTGSYSFAMGRNTIASGPFSVAMGSSTEAIGNLSIAMGNYSTASGSESTAMGSSTEASGLVSTAMGDYSTASGSVSTAMGSLTNAGGTYSTAMGRFTSAQAYSSLAVGAHNEGIGNPTEWVSTDPIFEVGNGYIINQTVHKSNALTVLKNGTVLAPSMLPGNIITGGGKVLITREYGDSVYENSGLEYIDESNIYNPNKIGWRLVYRDPTNYGLIGSLAVDLSYSNTISEIYGATGDYSIATGYESTASGWASTAMGIGTEAAGSHSTSFGFHSTASGAISTAMGDNSTASGSASTAMGYNTTAKSYASLAIGRYNLSDGNSTYWNSLDPIFEVGNGSSSTLKSNAFTILKNGNIGIGTAHPITKLQITGGSDASYYNSSGYLVLGDHLGINMVMDDNEIIARNNGATSNLYFQNDGGRVYVGGVLEHGSDRRLKNDINDVEYGLKEVLALRPVSFYWKSDQEAIQKSLGFIAQEVQPLINDLVSVNTKRKNTLALDYTGIIAVLTKAIQEQQEIIEEQKEEYDKKYDKLLKRVEQLELVSNQ